MIMISTINFSTKKVIAVFHCSFVYLEGYNRYLIWFLLWNSTKGDKTPHLRHLVTLNFSIAACCIIDKRISIRIWHPGCATFPNAPFPRIAHRSEKFLPLIIDITLYISRWYTSWLSDMYLYLFD